MLINDTMHPRIADLARVLLPMIENPAARPTSHDRNKLVDVREKIKRLPEEDGINLSDRDEDDRRYLYVESTRLAQEQEGFYEKNGKWEPMTKEQLIEMGAKAPLDDQLFNAFPVGNLSSFASKELLEICKVLRVRTIGQLVEKIRKEHLDSQELKCEHKTLQWIDVVCRELKIEFPNGPVPA